MTQIINFTGGPGAGKSTMAYQLFGWMKTKTMEAAFVPEFATELCWNDRKKELDDQFYVSAIHHHRIYNLLNTVDWIVTDSSLFLGINYADESFKKYTENLDDIRWAMKSLLMHLYYNQPNITFFVDRTVRPFIPKGRAHTQEQSEKIDGRVKELLDSYQVPYYNVTSLDEVLKVLDFSDK